MLAVSLGGLFGLGCSGPEVPTSFTALQTFADRRRLVCCIDRGLDITDVAYEG